MAGFTLLPKPEPLRPTQAVVDGRRLAEAEAEASRLGDANDLLRGGADWDELETLRAEVLDNPPP